MADEHTPMSHDDAVDPSEPDFEVAEPGTDPQQDSELLAEQARRSRPRRRTQPSAQPPDASAPSGATAVPPPEAPTAMPRPVRRTRPAQPEAGEPDLEAAEPVHSPATAAVVSQSRPVRRSQQLEPATEQRSSRGRSKAVEPGRPRRTTPAAFVGQSVDELRKVIWPTGSQLSQYFLVVLVFVLFIVAYVGVLDPVFGWVLLQAFGK